MVVKLFYFREWDRVFLYSTVVDSGVGESLLAQLLLPGPHKDAVESGAESYVKYVDADKGGDRGIPSVVAGVAEFVPTVLESMEEFLVQMFQPALYVDVHCLCICTVGGVVCFAKLCELQCGASVCAGCNGVLHLSLWFTEQN